MIERNKTIGASEIGAIMGVNPYRTPVDVWLVKTGRQPEFEGNEATNRGLLLEPAIGAWFARHTGRFVENCQVTHFAGEHCSATPDFTYETEKGKLGLLECKSTAQRIADPEDLPQSWFLQVMFQAGVLGNVEEVSIAMLAGDLQFKLAVYEPESEFCKHLMDFADAWYKNHVIADVMPEPANVSDLKKLYKQAQGSIEAGDSMREILQKMKDLKTEIAIKEKELEEMKANVMLIMRDAEAVEADGKTLCTWKFSKPTKKFDANTLKAEMPDVYEKYLKETEPNRVFLLK